MGSLCRVFDADMFTLPRIWKEIQENVNYRARQKDIADFNKTCAWRKRGMTLTPCRYSHTSSEPLFMLWQGLIGWYILGMHWTRLGACINFMTPSP